MIKVNKLRKTSALLFLNHCCVTSCQQEELPVTGTDHNLKMFIVCTYRDLVNWESFRMFDLKKKKLIFFLSLSQN